MSPAPDDALTRAMDRAVVDHFGDAGRADPEQVVVAACTVAGTHIARVPDPVARCVLVARAQWTITRVMAEILKAARKGGARGRERHGP